MREMDGKWRGRIGSAEEARPQADPRRGWNMKRTS